MAFRYFFNWCFGRRDDVKELTDADSARRQELSDLRIQLEDAKADAKIAWGRVNTELTREYQRNQDREYRLLRDRDEAQRKIQQIQVDASERWKLVAIAVGLEIREPGPGEEYMPKPIYTAEYVLEGVRKIKAQRDRLEVEKQALLNEFKGA